jgi:hypothetical protein
MQRLRVLDATILSNVDVPCLMQLRKDSLFVTIGDAALKLKHGANRIKEFLFLGWLKFPQSVGDVLNQIRVQLCCWNSSSLPLLRVCFLFLFPSQLNQKLRQSEFVTITKLLQLLGHLVVGHGNFHPSFSERLFNQKAQDDFAAYHVISTLAVTALFVRTEYVLSKTNTYSPGGKLTLMLATVIFSEL